MPDVCQVLPEEWYRKSARFSTIFKSGTAVCRTVPRKRPRPPRERCQQVWGGAPAEDGFQWLSRSFKHGWPLCRPMFAEFRGGAPARPLSKSKYAQPRGVFRVSTCMNRLWPSRRQMSRERTILGKNKGVSLPNRLGGLRERPLNSPGAGPGHFNAFHASQNASPWDVSIIGDRVCRAYVCWV